MTFDEFVARMATLPKHGFEPFMDAGRYIRFRKDNYCWCPISAVLQLVRGEFQPNANYDSAGITLGLSLAIIHIIVNAADDHLRMAGQPYGEKAEAVVIARKRMLGALGLEEAA